MQIAREFYPILLKFSTFFAQKSNIDSYGLKADGFQTEPADAFNSGINLWLARGKGY